MNIEIEHRPAVAWVGAAITVSSVRTNLECEGVVDAAVDGLLYVRFSAYRDTLTDIFHPGDNLRIGWSADGRWHHGEALCAALDTDREHVTISTPRSRDDIELRRAHARGEYFATCALRRTDGPRGAKGTVDGRIFDLSAGGMRARTAVPVNVDSAVMVRLDLPTGTVVTVGRVVHADERFTHVAFTATRPADRMRIAEALAARLTDQ